mgnify:CR=1 FL=1
MAVKIMAGVGAALFLVGIILTCATMFFADITWREVADVLEESPLHVDVRSREGNWRRGLGWIRSDDGPLRIYFGNTEITIDW